MHILITFELNGFQVILMTIKDKLSIETLDIRGTVKQKPLGTGRYEKGLSVKMTEKISL